MQKSLSTIHLGETEQLEEMDKVRAIGVITGLRTKIDKSGRTMAFFTLDDFSGSCECLMFSKTYEKYSNLVKEEECVVMIGTPESSGDAIKLHIEEVIPLEQSRSRFAQSVKIIFDKEKNNEKDIFTLKSIFQKYKGDYPVYIHLANNGSKAKLFYIENYKVNLLDDFIGEVIDLLGEDSLLFNKK